MKRFISLGVTLLLLYAMLLAVIPSSAAITSGPYSYEKGTIQDVKIDATKVLGRGKANYYQATVTSLMQNEADRVQSYTTHVAVGTKDAKFFVYAAESDNKLKYGLMNTLDIAKAFEASHPDYQVLAAVNGDFFNTATGEPEEPMIQDGHMLKAYLLSDMTGRGMVGVNANTGTVVYHTVGAAYKSAGYGVEYKFNGAYQVRVYSADESKIEVSYASSLANSPTATEISFTTSDYGKGDYEGKKVYVVELEKYRKDTGSHNQDARTDAYYYAYGKITEAIDGTKNMKPEAGKAYIAVANDTQAPKLVIGAYVECQRTLQGAWENVSNAVGFKQQLMADGNILFENMYSRYHHSLKGGSSSGYKEAADYYCDCGSSKSRDEKWTEDLYDYPMCWKSRTAIGFKANGECVMMTIDKSNEGKWGATYVEIASQLKALGCVNAFLLDGGGSSTMVIRQGDELVTAYAGENQPNGRKVANAVIIAVPKEAPINTDDLTDAIAKAEGMKKADYSASAKDWEAFTNTLDEAKAILADETSTQEWIDIVCESLVSTIADIEKTKKTDKADETDKATEAPATDANNDVDEPAIDNSGCGSSIAISAIVAVGAIGAVATRKRKRK